MLPEDLFFAFQAQTKFVNHNIRFMCVCVCIYIYIYIVSGNPIETFLDLNIGPQSDIPSAQPTRLHPDGYIGFVYLFIGRDL